MITKPSGLLVFLNTFGVQEEKDQKKKFHPTEAIARIKDVSDFIENCEVEARQLAGEQQVAGFFKVQMVCALRKQYEISS